MSKYRRTRKACSMDKQDRISKMVERAPAASAARQFIHKAYQSYSSVDEYMKSKGMREVGQSAED